MAPRELRIVLGFTALSAAALCLADEPVRIEGLRHSWKWEDGGLAAKLKCVSAPTGECYFRLYRNATPASVERVAVGQEVTFRFGSNGAGYCVAVVAAKEAPCESKFITAGFHFPQQQP